MEKEETVKDQKKTLKIEMAFYLIVSTIFATLCVIKGSLSLMLLMGIFAMEGFSNILEIAILDKRQIINKKILGGKNK